MKTLLQMVSTMDEYYRQVTEYIYFNNRNDEYLVFSHEGNLVSILPDFGAANIAYMQSCGLLVTEEPEEETVEEEELTLPEQDEEEEDTEWLLRLMEYANQKADEAEQRKADEYETANEFFNQPDEEGMEEDEPDYGYEFTINPNWCYHEMAYYAGKCVEDARMTWFNVQVDKGHMKEVIVERINK